jgi:hypothetical protein
MIRRFSALLLGLVLVVLSVTPVAATTSVPGWTIWSGDADGYHVEWSATEYTHAYSGSVSFDLRNNISRGMSMGLSFSNHYFVQDTKVGGTRWEPGQLDTRWFYMPSGTTTIPAARFSLGVKTNAGCYFWETCDLSWSGYFYY